MTRSFTVVESPVGDLTLTAADGALTGIYFPGHRYPPKAETLGDRSDRGFEAATKQLAEYFGGTRESFDLPLAPSGTPFQQSVWAMLREVPYGVTRSYTELTLTLGPVERIRAVAAANGRNPLSIVVPCHRIVGSDGSLTGYAGGLERKRFLLDLEQGPASGSLF